MRKLNTEEISAKYNLVRDKNVGKKFSYEQVIKMLVDNGLSKSIAYKIIKNPTLMQQFKREGQGRGRHIGYTLPYTPIYKSWFETWLYPPSTTTKLSIEEEYSEYLKKKGYLLKKCIGFDEDSFKKDYPQLYEKYLIYESV
jgi:hypothetical protein